MCSDNTLHRDTRRSRRLWLRRRPRDFRDEFHQGFFFLCRHISLGQGAAFYYYAAVRSFKLSQTANFAFGYATAPSSFARLSRRVFDVFGERIGRVIVVCGPRSHVWILGRESCLSCKKRSGRWDGNRGERACTLFNAPGTGWGGNEGITTCWRRRRRPLGEHGVREYLLLLLLPPRRGMTGGGRAGGARAGESPSPPPRLVSAPLLPGTKARTHKDVVWRAAAMAGGGARVVRMRVRASSATGEKTEFRCRVRRRITRIGPAGRPRPRPQYKRLPEPRSRALSFSSVCLCVCRCASSVNPRCSQFFSYVFSPSSFSPKSRHCWLGDRGSTSRTAAHQVKSPSLSGIPGRGTVRFWSMAVLFLSIESVASRTVIAVRGVWSRQKRKRSPTEFPKKKKRSESAYYSPLVGRYYTVMGLSDHIPSPPSFLSTAFNRCPPFLAYPIPPPPPRKPCSGDTRRTQRDGRLTIFRVLSEHVKIDNRFSASFSRNDSSAQWTACITPVVIIVASPA